MSQDFTPTRTAGLERLSKFVPIAGRDYAARRNFDLGAGQHAHVSNLSPWLRCRLVTEEEVIGAVLGRHSASAAEKFIQEVFWRTYWKGWLEMRPDVWGQYRQGVERGWNDLQTQAGLRAKWETACRGETGIDCFDAWSRELADTGYLHNHARMWFASIWIFTLDLPWELGADFFLRHLLDGDPASNTLGWRWVAGIQTPGKTYLARTSNIAKFTEGRFHPKWQLASDAPARTAPPVPVPCPLPDMTPPDPKLRSGFLLHEEDLCPGFALEGLAPVASAVLAPQWGAGPLQPARQVLEFRRAAQDDVCARWKDRLGPATWLSGADDIQRWARDNRLDQIVTPYATVGPTATVLDAAQTAEGFRMCRVMRPYDRLTWPKATKGFFPFKRHIPDFIFNLRENHTGWG